MDIELILKSIKQACHDTPALIVVGLLVVGISIYLMVDAHRCKKGRPRHRGK
jgi:hypothetical protein